MMRRDIMLAGIILLCAGITKGVYDHGQRRLGAMQEQLRVADSTAAALQGRVGRVDTVYHVDSAALRAAQAGYLAARRHLAEALAVPATPDTNVYVEWGNPNAPRATDTATVVPAVPVVAFMAAADSTIQACRAVVQTCEQRVALRDSLLEVRDRQLALWQAQRPSRVRPWLERAVWIGLVWAVRR